MTPKDKQTIIDFINTLVPEIRDKLINENIGDNSFTRYRTKEFPNLSFKRKLLCAIDSFSWCYSKSTIAWDGLYDAIYAAGEKEILKFKAEINLITRDITL